MDREKREKEGKKQGVSKHDEILRREKVRQKNDVSAAGARTSKFWPFVLLTVVDCTVLYLISAVQSVFVRYTEQQSLKKSEKLEAKKKKCAALAVILLTGYFYRGGDSLYSIVQYVSTAQDSLSRRNTHKVARLLQVEQATLG